MQRDAQGLVLSVNSEAAARAFDHTVAGYLGYRLDTAARLQALLDADPEFGLGYALKAAFMLLAYKQALIAPAQQAIETAARLTVHATPREQAHVAAIGAWASGRQDRAIAIWESIFKAHPRDILAFRLHHFCSFWLGQPERMFDAVEQVLPHWSAAVPGFANVLACRSFAHEECGNYVVAEAAGRDAIALDPTDLWAAHAVAHVLEMQGRRTEGVDWIARLEGHWDGGNNLMHHLWWHQAMYRLEQRDFAGVLELYDQRFRNLASPVTQQLPDLYIDVQNAASMLFRLGLHGVDPGTRWTELADKAEARIGDCLSAFTLPHWMMALAACGRRGAAEHMISAMRDYAEATPSPHGILVGRVAVPICQALLQTAEGDAAGAVESMRPILGEMYRLGGSHAQQDVLEQFYLHSAMRAGLDADVRTLLERVSGRHVVPPARRVGYAGAAARTGY